MSSVPTRGVVVKGPDLLADHRYRPYVCLSDELHPFADEEGLYAAVTTTPRTVAIEFSPTDFVTGGLPEQRYVNPWTIVSIRHSDIQQNEGRLIDATSTTIAENAASYLGVE